jgi:glutamate/tyrosine decarboxylase-like PLP-dependent enzyme
MTRSDRPVHPGDFPLDELRAVGRAAYEAIADYHRTLDRRAVVPAVDPAEVTALFRGELPEGGAGAAELLEEWRRRVLPNLAAVGSPRHFAYVNGSGAMAGILAETLAAGTATNPFAWRLAPAGAAMERQCLRWIARFAGYPEGAGGVLVSGATMANFTALTAALRHLAPYDSTPSGLQDARRSGRFLLYHADHEGHASIVRVADLMNLGRDAVRRVPSRDDFTMDPAALDRMLAEDRARGDLPLAVVAQLGSVNVGAVDPVAELAEVAARHGVWLHGDGAVGLLAAGAPSTRPLFRGLERLDSIAFDAHKLLGVPPDCGVALVRERERLRRAFSLTAPYLRDRLEEADAEAAEAEAEVDFLELGPQMSRGFRALKLWMTMRQLGASGLRALVEKNVGLARRLHRLAEEHPDFETFHAPSLYIVSFRFVPDALGEPAGPVASEWLDRLNLEIAAAIRRSGLAFVATTRIRGRVALRFSIASHRTTERDVDATFDAIAFLGRSFARSLPDFLSPAGRAA